MVSSKTQDIVTSPVCGFVLVQVTLIYLVAIAGIAVIYVPTNLSLCRSGDTECLILHVSSAL